ncbi:hypothetical protein [Microcoleus phage My-WqHQDG]|nr:hypothetical protein [Microcoleus phage My-WqHQDG]
MLVISVTLEYLNGSAPAQVLLENMQGVNSNNTLIAGTEYVLLPEDCYVLPVDHVTMWKWRRTRYYPPLG